MKLPLISLAALSLFAVTSCVVPSNNSSQAERVEGYQPEAREWEKVRAEAFEYFEANRLRKASTVVRLSPPEMIESLGGPKVATEKYQAGKWGQEMSMARIGMYRLYGQAVALRSSKQELIFIPYRARAAAFPEGGELQSYTLATRATGSQWSYVDGTVIKRGELYRKFPGLTTEDVPPVKGEINPPMLRPGGIL